MSKKRDRRMSRLNREQRRKNLEHRKMVERKLMEFDKFTDYVFEVCNEDREVFLDTDFEEFMWLGFCTKLILLHVTSIMQEYGYKTTNISLPTCFSDFTQCECTPEFLENGSVDMLYEYIDNNFFDSFPDISHSIVDFDDVESEDYNFYKKYLGTENEQKAIWLRESLDDECENYENDDYFTDLYMRTFKCERLGRLLTCVKEHPCLEYKYKGLKSFINICKFQMYNPFELVFKSFSDMFLHDGVFETYVTTGYSDSWAKEAHSGLISPFAFVVFTIMPEYLSFLEENIPELKEMIAKENAYAECAAA